MLLRASSELQGNAVDLHAVTEGIGALPGVPAQDLLIAFAEAAVQGDAEALPAAREALRAELGDAALVDTAAIVANFQRMVRIADGTGIPLDAPVAWISAGIREELGLDAYGSADLTPAVTGVKRLLGRALGPLAMRVGKYLLPSSKESGA